MVLRHGIRLPKKEPMSCRSMPPPVQLRLKKAPAPHLERARQRARLSSCTPRCPACVGGEREEVERPEFKERSPRRPCDAVCASTRAQTPARMKGGGRPMATPGGQDQGARQGGARPGRLGRERGRRRRRRPWPGGRPTPCHRRPGRGARFRSPCDRCATRRWRGRASPRSPLWSRVERVVRAGCGGAEWAVSEDVGCGM